MRWIYRIFIGLVFILAVLTVSGLVLPAPKPPAKGKIITLASGDKINIYQQGQGQDIILVHGLPGSAQDWQELAGKLAKRGFRAIYYDRIGYGHSSRRNTAGKYTIAQNAKELDALIAAMGLENPALIGWSFGGGVVQSSKAAQNPDTPFIILVASVGPDMIINNPKPPVGGLTKWLMRLPVFGKIGTRLSIKKQFGNALPEKWIEAQRPLLLMPGTLESMNAEMKLLDPENLKPEKIAAPVLIIHGDKDEMVPYSVGRGLKSKIKNSELVTLSGAGHMLPLINSAPLTEAIAGFARERAFLGMVEKIEAAKQEEAKDAPGQEEDKTTNKQEEK